MNILDNGKEDLWSLFQNMSPRRSWLLISKICTRNYLHAISHHNGEGSRYIFLYLPDILEFFRLQVISSKMITSNMMSTPTQTPNTMVRRSCRSWCMMGVYRIRNMATTEIHTPCIDGRRQSLSLQGATHFDVETPGTTFGKKSVWEYDPLTQNLIHNSFVFMRLGPLSFTFMQFYTDSYWRKK